MSGNGARLTAVGIGLAALGLSAADLVLIALAGASADEGGAVGAAVWSIGLVGAPVVGLVLATRRPGNLYGWLLLSFGLFSGASNFAGHLAEYLYATRGALHPGIVPAALTESLLWPAFPMHLPMLLLYFPDGRLPTPRWRWLPRAVVGVGVPASMLAAWMPGELGVAGRTNPYAASGTLGTVVQVIVFVTVIAMFAAVVVAAGTMVGRWRRAVGQERLQLRWFMFAAGLQVAVLVGTGAGSMVANEVLNSILFSIPMLGMFIAIGVAVLRYRLYEIDRIISRTVTYGALTVVLAGVYLGAVTVMTTATASRAGSSPVGIAAATLVAAAVFGPARRRIQASVDRRFNRARYDAARTLETFRIRLRDEVELDAVSGDLLEALDATLAPAGSWLWLRPQGGGR